MIEKIQKKYALSPKGAKDLIRACFACLLVNLCLMLPAVLFYYLVRQLMADQIPARHLPFYGVGVVVCLVLILLTSYFQFTSTFYATYRESGVRRITLAEKLRKLPMAFFGKKDLADLTNTVMSDCTFLEQAFSHFVPELFGAMISTTLIAISLLFFNWRMALAALWVIPVSFAIIFVSVRIQDRLNRKQIEARNVCADGIQECIEAVRDLKSNNGENAYLTGLDRKIKAVEKRAVISEFGTAAFVGTAQLILKLGIATVALTGSLLLTSGSIDLLTFIAFMVVASRLYDPLQAAVGNLAALITTQSYVDRMNEILYSPVQKGKGRLENQGYDIVFDHVGFSYNGREAVLNDVSFTARQGEVTAVVGPSGGGKTTVSRLAARFWDVSRGRITVGGMDIAEVEPETLLSLYSIVFQDVTLFNNTIMENIRIGRKDASDEDVLRAARLAHCDQFAEKLPEGWNTLIGENGRRLSGGERQRISIARAFLKDAPIILLDEATASLDVENETLIQSALSRLIQEKTVLVIAHRMRTVAGADKVVVLEDGIVSEQGAPEELMKQNGMYCHMVQLQNESQNWALK